MASRIVGLLSLLALGACARPTLEVPTPDAATLEEMARVEREGREMFDLDRAASLATDEMARRGVVGTDESVRGWIVVPEAAGWLVRFLAADGDSFAVAYDVFVSKAGATMVREDGAALSAAQMAMFRARETALAAITMACSTDVNTVVLPTPERDGAWTVYVLAAAPTREIIVGVHHRMRVSSDGRRVVEDVPLSQSCLRIDPASIPENARTVGIVVGQPGWPTPVETHVFLSLAHALPLYVRTPAGTWRVRNGDVELVGAPPAR